MLVSSSSLLVHLADGWYTRSILEPSTLVSPIRLHYTVTQEWLWRWVRFFWIFFWIVANQAWGLEARMSYGKIWQNLRPSALRQRSTTNRGSILPCLYGHSSCSFTTTTHSTCSRLWDTLWRTFMILRWTAGQTGHNSLDLPKTDADSQLCGGVNCIYEYTEYQPMQCMQLMPGVDCRRTAGCIIATIFHPLFRFQFIYFWLLRFSLGPYLWVAANRIDLELSVTDLVDWGTTDDGWSIWKRPHLLELTFTSWSLKRSHYITSFIMKFRNTWSLLCASLQLMNL